MKRAGVIVLVLVVVGAAVAFVQRFRASGPNRLADPDTVALPPVADTSAAAAYLRADGAVLVELSRRTRPWQDQVPTAQSTCADAIRITLADLPGPAAMGGVGARIPDPASSSMAQEYVTTVSDHLRRCAAAADTSSSAPALRFAATVFARRLHELGVA